MAREVLRHLADPQVIGLTCALHDWPRTLLNPRLIPDGWQALIEEPDGRRRCIRSGEAPEAEADRARLVLARDTPFVIPVESVTATSADGHSVRASGRFEFAFHGASDDLAAAGRSLFAAGPLTSAAAQVAFRESGLDAALERFVRRRRAADLVAQDQRMALRDETREFMARFLFDAGCRLESVPSAAFASATLEREVARQRDVQQRADETRAREMLEQAARAAALRRLDDLGQLLGKLRQAAGAAEGWHALLPSLNPAERGRLLENLWRIAPGQFKARAIVLVAGSEVVVLDPAAPDRMLHRWALPDDLGGLRSVCWLEAGGRLAVGAASGVWLIDPDDGAISARLSVPDAGAPRSGFNAVASVPAGIAATHSELGCWLWETGANEPIALLRPVNGTPRTLRAATAMEGGRLLFSADDRVCIHALSGGGTTELPGCNAPVHDVAVTREGSVYATTARGDVLRGTLDPDTTWEVLHHAPGPVESIVVRRWNDLTELLIPAGRQGVLGVWGDEGVVSRLLDTSAPVRRIAACDDTIVALTDTRDALLVLNEHTPARTPRHVPLARVLSRSIQDVCIVTA